MFKGLSNLGELFKQARQVSGRMQQLNDLLKDRRATGAAGGGMVEVDINGLLEVLQCRISPQLFADGDRELLEDLVAAAANQALGRAKELQMEAMKELTGGLDLSGIQETVGKLLGGGKPDQESTA